jgi:peptide/nickel transport system substrate-binding protein
MKRISRAAVLAASIALVVSGCATGPTPGGDPTPTTGGEIVVGAAHSISQLNPAVITLAFETTLYPLVWNGLTKQAEDGSVVGDLATEWTHNEDATEWTFTLHEGVTWHDGTPLTAEDVVQAFQYHLDPATGAKYYSKIKLIDDVSAPDDLTVVLHTSQPLAVLPLAITDIRIIDVDNLDTINTIPNGTGPFKVTDFVPDDHVTLERNADYWGDPSPLDKIEIVKIADSTAALTALRAGDTDVMYDLSFADAGKFGEDPDYTVITAEPYHWTQTWKIDTTSPPFDKVEARQALSYATDRQKILDVAYYGFGVAAETNNPVSPEAPFYAPSGLTDYSYDLDKAAELFAEAGVNEGDTITWWGPAGIQPEKVAAAEILKDSLSQIGINLDIQLRPIAEWTPVFIPVGKSFPGYIAPTGSATPNDPAYVFQFARQGACECNWANADFEEAYNNALAIADDQERTEAFYELQQIISDQVPVIIPLITSFLSVTQSDVKGVWSNLSGTVLHLENASLGD